MNTAEGQQGPRIIASFCHVDQNCCPVLSEAPEAGPDRQFVITDDFGGKVEMSREQLRGFIEKVKTGKVTI